MFVLLLVSSWFSMFKVFLYVSIFGVICVLSGLGVLGFFSETCNCCLGKVRRRCNTTTCIGVNIYLPEGQSYICVLFHKMKWSFPR